MQSSEVGLDQEITYSAVREPRLIRRRSVETSAASMLCDDDTSLE